MRNITVNEILNRDGSFDTAPSFVSGHYFVRLDAERTIPLTSHYTKASQRCF